MSFNSISGFGSNYYSYSNSLNQQKLSQALSNNSVSKNYYDKKYQNQAKATMKDSQKFISQYNNSMSSLLQSANKLKNSNTSGVMSKKEAISSNNDVLTASKKYSWDNSSDKYSVKVKQLATEQSNTGKSSFSSDQASGNAEFSIGTKNGPASFSVSAKTADGKQKTNSQQLTDIAKEINSRGIGVKASVISEGGKSSLKLTSAKTGAESAFTVSGKFADSNNLNEQSAVAQDAEYTLKVNGGEEKELSSASNNISLNNGKIDVALKATGTSDVVMAADSGKVITAVEDLIKSYNSSLTVLNDNADRGSGVKRQLGNMLNGPVSENKMEMVGISVKKDGTLVLDKEKLQESLTKDPSITRDIIGGASGIAQGIFSDARSGLNISSSSLINNDVKKAQKQTLDDPIQFTNMFSKRGAFNMINRATVGMMFDMLI